MQFESPPSKKHPSHPPPPTDQLQAKCCLPLAPQQGASMGQLVVQVNQRESLHGKSGLALTSFSPSFHWTPYRGKTNLDEKKKRFALTPFRRRGLLRPAHLCSRLHGQIPLVPCPGYRGRSCSDSLPGLKSLQSPGRTPPCCWGGLDGMNLWRRPRDSMREGADRFGEGPLSCPGG